MEDEEQDLLDIDPEQELATLGKRLEARTSIDARPLCAPHGRPYDPKVAKGCTICVQEAKEVEDSRASLRKALIAAGIVIGLSVLWQLAGWLTSTPSPKRATPRPTKAVEQRAADTEPEADQAAPAEDAANQGSEETSGLPAAAPVAADPQAVEALRKAASDASAMIKSARSDLRDLATGLSGSSEGIAESVAVRWQAWRKDWADQLQKLHGGLPSEPSGDADMNLILGQQELENSLVELDRLGALEEAPVPAEAKAHLDAASRSLQDATDSLNKIR